MPATTTQPAVLSSPARSAAFSDVVLELGLLEAAVLLAGAVVMLASVAELCAEVVEMLEETDDDDEATLDDDWGSLVLEDGLTDDEVVTAAEAVMTTLRSGVTDGLGWSVVV